MFSVVCPVTGRERGHWKEGRGAVGNCGECQSVVGSQTWGTMCTSENVLTNRPSVQHTYLGESKGRAKRDSLCALREGCPQNHHLEDACPRVANTVSAVLEKLTLAVFAPPAQCSGNLCAHTFLGVVPTLWLPESRAEVGSPPSLPFLTHF